MPRAVIFDLDGIIVDSEAAWDQARRDLAAEHGHEWPDGATAAMMGMSSPEWSAYMRDDVGVPRTAEQINAWVVADLERRYHEQLPLIDGAREAVVALAAAWPLGLASSSNRQVIDLVLAEAGIDGCFAATVSSEEVGRGKPAPDVYLEAASRLGVAPGDCVAIEDSSNGIRSAAAAGMRVVAIPNAEFPPAADALALAAVTLTTIRELTVDRL